MSELELGRGRGADDQHVRLPTHALLRHMMALGSSGSGKTVLSKIVVEEVVRAGIPALLLDPQGDLCSLALAAEDPDALAGRGLDPALARDFAQQCDVVIFTPASSVGVALGADPIAALAASHDDAGQIDEELWTRVAGTIASLLGYSTDDDDGEGFVAVLDKILRELAEAGRAPSSLRELCDHLTSLDDAGLEPYARFWKLESLRGAIRKLARLEVGPRRRLFESGVPLDIDLLLGRSGAAQVPAGKTRVAIVYLNSLHQQEDKEFLVAALADRLYAWMLAHPSPEPQLLFYLDEVAPYVPPVRKPQCKDSLQLLFKQARKYGVCCLMATQNPGDVDYRAMAQFGTWALGRLMTRQDIKKIEPTVKSLAPAECDEILTQLPSLEPGQFVLLSPDHFPKPVGLQARWLYTEHATLDERRIAALADERWRERFATLVERAPSKPSAKPSSEDAPSEDASDEAGKQSGKKASSKKASSKKASSKKTSSKKTSSKKTSSENEPPATAAAPPEPAATEGEPGSKSERTEAEREAQLATLRTNGPLDVRRFAELLGCSESKARRALELLVEAKLVGGFKQGRASSYWALDTGTRPDIGMPDTVWSATPNLGQDQAAVLGQGLLRSSILGFGDPVESLMNVTLVHKLVWRVDFEEHIETGLLGRLMGSTREQRLGTVYLHPRALTTLTWEQGRGLRFVERPSEHASDVRDLDGVVRFVRLAPANLRFDDEDWLTRASQQQVHSVVVTRWPNLKIVDLAPCFVPLWKLLIRRHEAAGMRVVTLDTITGNAIEWPM